MTELEKAHARIEELETQEVELCTLYGIAQAENGKLRADLEAIGAGGVSGPLMTPLPGAQPALSAGWVSLPGALPKPGTPVLLDIGNKYPIRAQWVPKDSLEATGDGDFGEYNEASDMYYWPEGWYEWNQYEETHWRVDETPRAWQPLPASPTIEGFTAQDPSQLCGFSAGDMASAAAQGFRDGLAAAQPVAQQGAAYAALPEPLEIDWPELHSQALGCGVEDRGLHNRYECAEYGWQDGVDKCAERVPEQIFDADQMRAFADATHAIRASHGQASSQAGEYPALVCDYCGALTPDPWHSSGMLHGKMSKHIHSCDACAAPVDAAVQQDAARYRLVRRGQRWSVIDGIGNDLRAEALDAAVDAARAAQKEGEKP